MDFQKIRKEYESCGIRKSDLGPDPLVAFGKWYGLAVEQSPDSWFEANAMTLSTSDGQGSVSARIVLLKGFDSDGFRFFTNYASTKGEQLDASPVAALTLHWPYQGRQVRIEGSVTKTSREVSDKYFHSRPRGSQIGAAASRQSSVVENREQLDEMAEALEKQFDGHEIPLPEQWGGYVLAPSRIEFWQGRFDRMHDRIVFRVDDNAWIVQRLAP